MKNFFRAFVVLLAAVFALGLCAVSFAQADSPAAVTPGEGASDGAAQAAPGAEDEPRAIMFKGIDPKEITDATIVVNTQITSISAVYVDEQEKQAIVEYSIVMLSGDESSVEYSVNENNELSLKASELVRFIIRAASDDGATVELTIDVRKQSMSLINIVMLAFGLYAIYYGIRGRGSMFNTETAKEGREKLLKLIVRVACLIVGVCLGVVGFMPVIDGYGRYGIVTTILFIGCIVIIAAAIITVNLLTDKEKREKARATRQTGGTPASAPNCAFEFDGSEPTLDDVIRSENENGDK